MKFTFNDFFWQANLQLPAWSDFLAGDTIVLAFAPEGRDGTPMRADEIMLAGWVQDNYEIQKPIALKAVLELYPEFRSQFFEDYNIAECEEDLPTINSTDDLARVLALEEIYVHQLSKDGVPYVGYKFACRWDEEHGLGILMQGNRIVDVGGADTAFLLWIAERDRDG